MRELLQVIKESFSQLGTSIAASFLGNKSTGDHSAAWGRESEFLSSTNTGFALTSNTLMSMSTSMEHVLICAGSGSGKTVNTTIPGVHHQQEASMIILDNSGEMFDKTAEAKRRDGYKVMLLDVSMESFTDQTIFYNPLERLTKNDSAGIAKLADLLVRQSSDKQDYWAIKSKEQIHLALRILLHQPKKQRHLYGLHTLLELMASREDEVSEHLAGMDDKIFRPWEVLLNNSKNTLDSIRSSAISATSFISYSDALAKVTSKDSIDFDILRTEKCAIYIKIPINDEIVRPIINMFFSQFFDHFLSRDLPKETDRKILVYGEEFGSTFIPNFPKILSNCRKYFIGCQMIVQSYSQLSKIYGKEGMDIIKANCSKMIFSGTDESEEVSRILGKVTFTDSKTKHKRDRELMSASEIRNMDAGTAIVLPKKGKPLLIKLRPFYSIARLLKRTKRKSTEAKATPIDIQLEPLTLSK